MNIFESIVEFSQNHKKTWVEATESGDMNPTVIGIRDGKPVLIVVAPLLDKELGLQSIMSLRATFGIDEAALITDTHAILTEGKSKEEIQRLIEKYSAPGSMQKACDEEGACDLGEIADAICVTFLHKDKTLSMAVRPYRYHGKDGGVEFEWLEHDCNDLEGAEIYNELDSKEAINEVFDDDSKEKKNRVSGYIPNSMLACMNVSNMQETESAKAMYAAQNIPEEDIQGIQETMIRKFLISEGYIVIEVASFCGNFEEYKKEMFVKYIHAFMNNENIRQAALKQLTELEAEIDDEEQLKKIQELKENFS